MIDKIIKQLRYYSYELDPVIIYNRIKSYIKRRWIYKSHILFSSKLKAGNWYDLDTRLFYCSFSSLVDFVEIECSSSYERHDRYFKRIKKRDAKAGIKYLEYLRDYQDEDSEFSGINHDIRIGAAEVLDLYMWWTEARQFRIDPWEQYFNTDNASKIDLNSYDIYNKITDIENSYYQEDTEMLVRLMKVRRFLWI